MRKDKYITYVGIFIHIIKWDSKRIFESERLTSLSQRKVYKQACSLEGKNQRIY